MTLTRIKFYDIWKLEGRECSLPLTTFFEGADRV